MRKKITAQIREIYNSLINRRTFPEEQKGCHKNTRGTEELLYKDHHILNGSKTRRKNLAMDWLQKGLRYGPPKQDTTLSQNV